jgi:hypothetical protein
MSRTFYQAHSGECPGAGLEGRVFSHALSLASAKCRVRTEVNKIRAMQIRYLLRAEDFSRHSHAAILQQ